MTSRSSERPPYLLDSGAATRAYGYGSESTSISLTVQWPTATLPFFKPSSRAADKDVPEPVPNLIPGVPIRE